MALLFGYLVSWASLVLLEDTSLKAYYRELLQILAIVQ